METIEKEENQQNKMSGNLVTRTEDRKTKFELEQEKVIDIMIYFLNEIYLNSFHPNLKNYFAKDNFILHK